MHLQGIAGLIVLLDIAWAVSEKRRNVNYKGSKFYELYQQDRSVRQQQMRRRGLSPSGFFCRYSYTKFFLFQEAKASESRFIGTRMS
jgi:hypothetical protein